MKKTFLFMAALLTAALLSLCMAGSMMTAGAVGASAETPEITISVNDSTGFYNYDFERVPYNSEPLTVSTDSEITGRTGDCTWELDGTKLTIRDMYAFCEYVENRW